MTTKKKRVPMMGAMRIEGRCNCTSPEHEMGQIEKCFYRYFYVRAKPGRPHWSPSGEAASFAHTSTFEGDDDE